MIWLKLDHTINSMPGTCDMSGLITNGRGDGLEISDSVSSFRMYRRGAVGTGRSERAVSAWTNQWMHGRQPPRILRGPPNTEASSSWWWRRWRRDSGRPEAWLRGSNLYWHVSNSRNCNTESLTCFFSVSTTDGWGCEGARIKGRYCRRTAHARLNLYVNVPHAE